MAQQRTDDTAPHRDSSPSRRSGLPKRLHERIDRHYKTLIKIVLAVGIVGYLVYVIEPERLWQTARTAEVDWIIAGLLLLPLNLALEGAVWTVLVRRVVPRAGARSSFAALLCGYAFGVVTPGRVGELAGRAFYLRYPDKWELGTVVFTQRLIDMIMAAAAGAIALLFYVEWVAPTPRAPWWGLFAFGMGTALVLTGATVLPHHTHRLLRRILPERAAARTAFLERLTMQHRVAVLSLSALRYGVYATQLVLLMLAFGPSPGLDVLYVGVGLTFLIKFIVPPVTFLDVGIREGAAVFFLGQLGGLQAAAFNGSFLLFTFNILVPALIGVPFVLRMRSYRPTPPMDDAAPRDG